MNDDNREFQLLVLTGIQVIIAGIATVIGKSATSEQQFQENARMWHRFTSSFSDDVLKFGNRPSNAERDD